MKVCYKVIPIPLSKTNQICKVRAIFILLKKIAKFLKGVIVCNLKLFSLIMEKYRIDRFLYRSLKNSRIY